MGPGTRSHCIVTADNYTKISVHTHCTMSISSRSSDILFPDDASHTHTSACTQTHTNTQTYTQFDNQALGGDKSLIIITSVR